VLVCWVFGWSGGSKLVKDSYVDAKLKAEEQKEKRKRSAKRPRWGRLAGGGV
jgi:hypothetical protein